MPQLLFALGLAICVAAVSAAEAGDAVVADEFERQRVVSDCDAYGAGFARLPGTSTCVRVSGQVRFEKRYSKSSNGGGGQVRMDFETRSD